MQIKISQGNSKMGKILSVSLPSVTSCREDAPCKLVCYARKLEGLRPSVRQAYETNWKVLNENPEQYWKEINAVLTLTRFFRFHVSGDIPSPEYLDNMVIAAGQNPHCNILCFTKRYEWVNDLVDNGGLIPENLHIIFSVWKGFECNNKYNFPEAHVRFKKTTPTFRPDAKDCPGNCSECAVAFENCWNLQKGEQIVFQKH